MMLHRQCKAYSVACLLFGAIASALPTWGQVTETTTTKEQSSAASSLEPTFLHNIRQVTTGMVKAGEGYFSPDGGTIIYQAVPQGYPFYQIYVQSLTGDDARRVSTGRGRTTCAYFHPNGKSILFASGHLDPQLSQTEEQARAQQAEDKKTGARRRYQWDFDPHMDIFAADLDGRNLRQLTDAKGYDAEGAYDDEGKQVAFCSDRDGDPDIYIMNADGSDARQLTNAPGYDGGPFISPNGKWVIFRSDRKKESYLQIHTIGIDGKNDVALTDNEGVNWAPYWHPTEPWIIWTGADHSNPKARPNYDLWLMKYEERDGKLAAASKPVRITDHTSADVLPVFSPDGKKLMWTSNRTADGQSQLFIANFDLDAAEKMLAAAER
ncbi:MAG: biopolymer transporter Tol [Pirellulales bacterium]